MGSPAPKPGQLIDLHPKLVDKWARRYIHLYKSEGSVIAKRWAVEFLHERARELMSERVKEILNKQKGPRK